MNFNLLTEKWIPVLRKDQTTDWISPDQMGESDIMSLHFPRPDFNGAVIQFLIGLLQSFAAPETERQWKKSLQEPPNSSVLSTLWGKYIEVFNLLGDGPRFMQSFEELKADSKPVSYLLIDSPGEQTLKENKDFFIKRGRVERLSLPMTAAALLCLQMNAPSGGAGHRTSLRGGGPLTILLEGDTLWQSLWLNVLPETEFLERLNFCDRNLGDLQHKFPWMGATRISKSGMPTEITDPVHTHPLHVFWAMPRRIRLCLESGIGKCSVSGAESEFGVSEYVTEAYGFNYKGVWQHPLSPYYFDKTQAPLCRHPKAHGVTYRHWTDYILAASDKDRKPLSSPALVVQYARTKRRSEVCEHRFWAFGYEMENMKAVSWQEYRVPARVFPEDIEQRLDIKDGITALVSAAEATISVLKSAVREASSVSSDTTSSIFYQETEAEFYIKTEQIVAVSGNSEKQNAVKQDWMNYLRREAEKMFDALAANFDITQGNMKRIAVARKDLMSKLYSKKMLPETLGLPSEKGGLNV